MTRNIYLGTSFDPILAASTPEEFGLALMQAFQTFQATNIPLRAKALANEIAEEKPDLIGLQEVALFTFSDGVGQPLPDLTLDYLSILQSALEQRGLKYSVASLNVLGDPLGPLPASTNLLASYQDRDAILIRDKFKPSISNEVHGAYSTLRTESAFGTPLTYTRGFQYIDLQFPGGTFRFANTHLEQAVNEAVVPINEAQADEFREFVLAGPNDNQDFRGAIIAVGDFNDTPDGLYGTGVVGLIDKKFVDSQKNEEGVFGKYQCMIMEGKLKTTKGTVQ